MSTSTRMTLAAAAATILGSAPIGSTFREQQWAIYAWFGVVVLMVISLAARRLRVPAVLVPFVGLVALGCYLTLMFTPDHAFLHFVPTLQSLREFRGALHNAFEDVRTLTTPAPATPGLTLLASGGVGLVAVAMDAIAVGLRRPAASGLVLLSAYAIPAAIAFDGVGWLPFVLAGFGYLVLLLAEGHERMLRWGRPVPYDDMPDQEARSWPVRSTGKRVGVAALMAAVAIPVVVPGFDNNSLYLLFGGSGDGSGTNRLGGSSLSPFTQMRNQLLLDKPQDVMQIKTDQQRPFYVRQMVLDTVDKEGNWKRSDLNGGSSASGDRLTLPSGTFRTNEETQFHATFEIGSVYRDNTLPLYGLPVRLTGLPGNWNYIPDSITAFTQAGNTRGLKYTESFLDPRPATADLEASPVVADAEVRRTWTRYPAAIPPQVKDTVRSLTEGKSTPYDRTLAIFDYFLRPDSGFSYSLSTKPGTSGNDLLDFLTNRQGFCQQYSSAMAVMLRIAGVPARVVVGYTPGTRKNGNWVIRTDNAHAWVEAYFSNLGWVPFDPTPLPGNGRVEQSYAPRPGNVPTQNPGNDSASAASGGSRQTNANKLPEEDRQAGASGAGSTSGVITPRRAVTVLVLLAVLLLMLSPMLARFATRRRRLRSSAGPDPADAAHRAWDELLATVEDLQVPLRAADTPRTTARRLADDLSLPGTAAAGLRLAALAEERARYATVAGVDGDLPTAVRAVRRGLKDVTSRRRRVRALLLPPSVITALGVRMASRWARTNLMVEHAGYTLRRQLAWRR